MTTTSQETRGTTLSGDELSPEQDPHKTEADNEHQSESSIYPIETEFKVRATFNDEGRHPFSTQIAIEIPFEVDRIPSQRTEEAREDLNRKIDWENPEIGTLGTITFTERGHTIKFYPEDERETKTVGDWVMEQFHYILEQTDASHFTESDISLQDIAGLQDIVHSNLPGEFITVEGKCHNCENTVTAETYAPKESEKGFAWCDCGIGSSYPRQTEPQER